MKVKRHDRRSFDNKPEIMTVQQCVDKLEGSWWKVGTVREMLEQGNELWTPYAVYTPFQED